MSRHFYLLFALFALVVSGCIKEDFDEPPIDDLTSLTPNASISDLLSLYRAGQPDAQVTEDWIIDAVVAADDESGNLFRQIVVQDETGGITLRLNQTDIFAQYPVGTEVYILAKGLYVGDFNNLPQLNGTPGEPIQEVLIGEYIKRGASDQPVNATTLTLNDLNDLPTLLRNVNTLIRLEGVQFVSSDTSQTYADEAVRQTLNRTLRDCFGNEIIVRTSGFASFAAQLTPGGNGSVTAVLTLFRDTKQLLLRDPSDVDLNGPRCEDGGGGELEGELVSISSLRAAFENGAATAPANTKIRGIIISDGAAGNTTFRNLHIQDASGGIAVRFAENHGFALGEEVEISTGGMELSEFNGLLQINNVPLSNAASRGTGTVTPRTATVAEVLANLEAWESTLVTIENATITGGSTLSGNLTVSDGTGSITTFVRNTAEFANDPVPSGTITLTAIVSQFNEAQLILRNRSDIAGGGGGGGGGGETNITAAALRSAFAGGANTVPAGTRLRGVVISDVNAGNITSRNIVVQDASGGIVVRFAEDPGVPLGKEVEIIVGGQELSEFNGLLQINNVPITSLTIVGDGTLPTPRMATIAEVLANSEAWESTLVQISNVTISGGGTYGGELTLTDATGSLPMFTRSQATFAGTAVPSGMVTVTGIVSQFRDNVQINLRSAADVRP